MSSLPEFKAFPSIPRLNREVVITEKLDGTNASVHIYKEGEELKILAGSRNRWLTLEQDNFGFCKWVQDNKEELVKLGEGTHYGEWWGVGIQTGYGLSERRFSLFNVHKWGEMYYAMRDGHETNFPKCCHVVPHLLTTDFTTENVNAVLAELKEKGSQAVPGFMKPEGIVIYHKHSNQLFKVTFEADEKGKSYGK